MKLHFLILMIIGKFRRLIMGKSIVDIKNMGDALRNTGYKNIESAVAEIVDNSVEAEAKDVFVILREGIALSGRKVVNEMGFLDNGIGMNDEVLSSCLGIGASTRQARRGMGRFGVGLPQASLHACPRIEVYSWQNGIKNAKKVFLDINKIKEGVQTEIEDPIETDIPDPYVDYIKYQEESNEYDFSKSGSLVIWKDCDRVKPKTRGPLISRLEFTLGQKFRYFIHDKVCKIKIICDENREFSTDVLPNDPLMLMDDNMILGDPNEPKKSFRYGEKEGLVSPFQPFSPDGKGNGEFILPVKYYDKNGNEAVSNVKLRFAIVKKEFYDKTAFPTGNPGNYAIGKHVAKMEGISVIRARREIDFARFDYYNVINDPTHRWWGCEIIFSPELDEVFGVANNKQSVDLKKVDQDDLDPNELQPIWNQLGDIIIPTIKDMIDKNKAAQQGSRKRKEVKTETTEIINNVEYDSDNINYEDEINKLDETQAYEVAEAGKEELKDMGVDDPTNEEGTEFVKNRVNIKYIAESPRGPAFDYKEVWKTTVITINTSHKFYKAFLSKIYDNPEVQTTFELFLASLYQSIRETNTYQDEQNDNLLGEWNSRLNKYIAEQLKPRDSK